jgi:phage gpG-like protein
VDRFTYTIDDDQARRFFEYAGFRARNLTDPLRRAGRTLLHHINLTFASEGAWVGERWPGLDPEYEEWKAEHYPGRPLLVQSGRMYRDAISERSISVHGNTLRYGFDSRYAGVQQHGAEWTTDRGHEAVIPERPFIKVTPGLIEQIENDFRVWLEELKATNRARRSISLPNPFD